MCTTDVYTDVYPDGRTNKYHRPSFCSQARNGLVCDNPVVYNHPARSMRWDEPTSQYLYPSRPLTPRHSSTASSNHSHRSGGNGNESDRSKGSSSKKNRSSGIYVNGTKVADLNSSKRKNRERIVIVDSPPTPRTPPQIPGTPYTAPPSPSTGWYGHSFPAAGPNIVDASPHTRPIIVDERRAPIEVEVVSNDTRRHHRRHHRHSHHHHGHSHAHRTPPSPHSDSYHSHSRSGSNSSASAAAAAAAAALRYGHPYVRESVERATVTTAETQQRHRERERQRHIQERIKAANDEIRRRAPVPIPAAPSPPPPPMHSSAYHQGAAAAAIAAAATATPAPAPLRRTVTTANMALPRSTERELVDAVRGLHLGLDGAGGATLRQRDPEEDARQARLRERLLPRRRFTVGPGSRRHRVVYEDGIYRWE